MKKLVSAVVVLAVALLAPSALTSAAGASTVSHGGVAVRVPTSATVGNNGTAAVTPTVSVAAGVHKEVRSVRTFIYRTGSARLVSSGAPTVRLRTGSYAVTVKVGYRSYRLVRHASDTTTRVYTGSGSYTSARLPLFVKHGVSYRPQRATAGVAPAHGQKPIPGCPGLPSVPAGASVWTDFHQGAASPLVVRTAELICSAAPGATVDIKTMFFVTGSSAVTRITDALQAVHRYRQVHVQILIDTSIAAIPHAVHNLRRALPFATVYWCHGACHSTSSHGKTHEKWVYVSRLDQRHRGGGAVLVTSTNFTGQQFDTVESGIFIAREPSINRAIASRWAGLVGCATHRSCSLTRTPLTWVGPANTKILFTPTSGDVYADALRGLHCYGGGSIDMLTLALTDRPTIAQLDRLRSEGCHIRLVIEYQPNQTVVRLFQPRGEYQHDKMMLVDIAGHRAVYEGSLQPVPSAMSDHDNAIVRSTKRDIVDTYRRWFAREWGYPRAFAWPVTNKPAPPAPPGSR